ncbi:MAG: hypothetical protein KDI72_10560 [Xanthomonadales bacterium]|nr:hypothetical protein [Xanthomonadales bacterium]
MRRLSDFPEVDDFAATPASFGKSPITVFSGHIETIGHFLQLAANAIGQRVIVVPLQWALAQH